MESIEGPLGIGRAYRVRWSDRIFTLFGFAFSLIVVIAAGTYGLAPARDTPAWFPIFALGLLAVICGILTLSTFYNRVILYPDAIEYRTVWSRTWLQFNEIRGRREYTAYRKIGGGARLRVVSSNGEVPMLDFQKNYNFDDAFWTWFNSLPDLGSSYLSP